MSERLTTALGALAALVALASALALALALIDSGGGGAGAATPSYAIEVRRGREPKAVPAGAPAPTGAVPALRRRPAAGPAFAIARLRSGARAQLWRQPGRGPVASLGPRTEFGSPQTLSVVRTEPGWLGVVSSQLANGQIGWIRRDPARVEIYWTKYSLHVDLSSLRLSLDYGKVTVGRFLVTVGALGSATPVGRYGVTDAIDFGSSPYYGCCALALSGHQTDLPADWTGGSRLAIHGTPGPVGGAESHGCIRATDATMRKLFRRLPLGTPLFVRS